MGFTPEGTHLLGRTTEQLAFGGAVGLDLFNNTLNVQNLDIPLSRKTPVSSLRQFRKFMRDHDIEVEREDVGTSTAIVAIGYSKLLAPEDGRPIFHTVLAPEDPSTDLIKNTMDEAGIDLRVTNFDYKYASNPRSLILPPLRDRTVVSFKMDSSPPIEFNHAEDAPDALVMGPQSGDMWPVGVHNGIEYANDRDIPIVVLASESQIKQTFDDQNKREAYRELVNNATGFFGNAYELKMTLDSLDVDTESEDLPTQARRLRDLSSDPMPYVRITNGRFGAIAIGPDDALSTLTVPRIRRLVNPLGGGDDSMAVSLYVLRSEGLSPEAIEKSLIKGGRASSMVLQAPDALSGQMNREGYMKRTRGYRVERIESKQWI